MTRRVYIAGPMSRESGRPRPCPRDHRGRTGTGPIRELGAVARRHAHPVHTLAETLAETH